MSAHQPFRALVVGAGLMGRWHAHAVRRLGGRIVGVVDPDRDRALSLTRGRRTTPVFAALEDALERTDPELVHVCTPLATHVHLIGAALDAGRHVLVEKPLASSATETEGLLRQARARGLHLVAGHQLACVPAIQHVRRALSAIAPVRHVDYVACSTGADAAGMDPDAVVADILPHPLSLLGELFDTPVAGRSWSAHWSGPGEARFQGQVGPVAVSLLISMHARPPRHTLRILGDHGTIHLDLFHGFWVPESGRVSRARKIIRPFSVSAQVSLRALTNLLARTARREPAYPGLRELVARCYAATRGTGGPPFTAEAQLDVATARDALMRLMASWQPQGPAPRPSMS